MQMERMDVQTNFTGFSQVCADFASNCSMNFELNGTFHKTEVYQSLYLWQLILVHLTKDFLVPFVTPIVLTIMCCHLWEVYNDCLRDPTSDLPLPPGGYGFPVVGETLGFILQGRKFFDKRRNEFGNVYKTHMLGKPTIRVIGVKNVKRILSNENDLVTSQWPKSTKLLVGDGSLTASTGNVHSARKKTLFKAFTSSALDGYTKIMQDITREYIESWCFMPKIFGYQEFKSLTFELSCRVLLGIKMNKAEKDDLMAHFDTFLSNIFSIPIKVPGLGLYKGLKAREKLLNKIGSCIEQKQRQGPSQRFNDALSLLMDMSGDGELSVTEIKDVGLELLFAGHETTASATVSIVLQLSKHPDVTQKIQEELKEHGLLEGCNGDLNLEKLNKMKYLTNVVKEAIRITPPVGGGYRKALKTFEIDGFQIPKGWTVAYSIRDTHEIGNQLVSNPDIFDPDRWNALQKRDHEHFMAFGGGRKGCAGKQFALLMLKIFTVEMVRSCKWSIPNVNPDMDIIPVPHPSDNLPMTITR